MSATGERVLSGLDGITSNLEDLHRDIDARPELSLQEHRTASLAANSLSNAGYDVAERVGSTTSWDC